MSETTEKGFTQDQIQFLPWERIDWGNGPKHGPCDHALRTKIYTGSDGCADQRCVKCGAHFEYAGDYD